MEYKVVTLSGEAAAGISARTNNGSKKMKDVIDGLWKRFYCEGIYETLSGGLNVVSFGIYTDYADDENGDYTVLVGCEVSEEQEDKMFSVCNIPAGKYAEFIIKGDAVNSVANTWKEIWS